MLGAQKAECPMPGVGFEAPTAVTLVFAGVAAWAVALAAGRTRLSGLFWAVYGTGMLYLAADEEFGLHERAGVALEHRGWAVSALHDTDGAVLAGIAACALAISAACYRELVRHPPVLAALLAGALLTALAFAVDDFGPGAGRWSLVEELAEWLAAGCLLAAAALRLRAHHATPASHVVEDAAGAAAAAQPDLPPVSSAPPPG
jgi:hypothetical protein